MTVDYIARGDLDPHFIDAKPSFMVKLSKADLVLQFYRPLATSSA